MNSKKPIRFSDYFNIDKASLKKLGVFDPILNVDTKVFVEPLLLKNSASEIIRHSYQTYKKFFEALLLLLRNSRSIDDKCWRAAKRMVNFPEYQYTCIGYSSANTDGRGSGIGFNDRIFQSANERLRAIVSKDIGYIWLDTTKSDQKKMLLKELKTSKSFFIETLKALKDYEFEHYDLENDHEGLYKWLANSEHFINFELSKETKECPDNVDALLFAATVIIHHFKDLIENKEIWRMFWTKHRSIYRHVREYYSHMIFFTVCSTWLTSQNSNIRLDLLRDEGPIRLKLSISDGCCLVLHIKHANNASLAKAYTDILEKCRYLDNEKHVFMIMNFEEKQSSQFKKIRVIENPICKISEIDVTKREQPKEVLEPLNDDFGFIEFENLDFERGGYIEEKRKGGLSSYQNYKPLKNQVEALCNEELAKKSYSSAQQLCMVVADTVIKEFPNLLDSFNPYKNHAIQGHDWTKPTFYEWCNAIFKAFQNTPMVVDN